MSSRVKPESIQVPPLDDDRILRHVTFGHGPCYRLLTWGTGRVDHHGKYVLGYALYAPSRLPAPPLFVGQDFACAPGAAVDSDDALRSLLGFLTLRPGDTDAEYFDDYTPEQLAFAASEAEPLQEWSFEPGSFGADYQPPAFIDVEGR